VKQAADALNVTPRTVYRMIVRGELVRCLTKPNHGMAVTRDSLDRVLAEMAPPKRTKRAV